MTEDDIAKRLSELGNTTRLAIFRFLVKHGCEGTPVGDIQAALNIPGSTLSHHLSRMMAAGLISQERDSRTLLCRPCFDAVHETVNYLTAECCSLSAKKTSSADGSCCD